MSNKANRFSQKLHTMKLVDFMVAHDMITVQADDVLDTAVRRMASNKIHALPVMDGNTCLGIIDMLDVVHHANLVSPISKDEKSLETAGRALALKTVKDVVNSSGRDPLAPLDVNEFANLAIDYFASGVHRAPIFDHNSKIVGSLSQSDMLRWLHEQSTTYFKKWDVLHKPVTVLGLGCGPVSCVCEDQPVIDAIKMLDKKGVSALPAINSDGHLVGTFSTTDLKNLFPERWPSFFLSVKEYLKEHSPKSLSSLGLPVNSTTLFEVLEHFYKHPYHRVWLLHNGKPIGVISHTDVMKFIRDYKEDSVVETPNA